MAGEAPASAPTAAATAAASAAQSASPLSSFVGSVGLAPNYVVMDLEKYSLPPLDQNNRPSANNNPNNLPIRMIDQIGQIECSTLFWRVDVSKDEYREILRPITDPNKDLAQIKVLMLEPGKMMYPLTALCVTYPKEYEHIVLSLQQQFFDGATRGVLATMKARPNTFPQDGSGEATSYAYRLDINFSIPEYEKTKIEIHETKKRLSIIASEIKDDGWEGMKNPANRNIANDLQKSVRKLDRKLDQIEVSMLEVSKDERFQNAFIEEIGKIASKSLLTHLENEWGKQKGMQAVNAALGSTPLE